MRVFQVPILCRKRLDGGGPQVLGHNPPPLCDLRAAVSSAYDLGGRERGDLQHCLQGDLDD